MTFEELGAYLRSEREKKNLDITAVANQLKINPRQLRAIEDGDVGSLPHPAYVRGFIRSYAGLLGLNAEEIQELLDNVPTLNNARTKKKFEKPAQEVDERPPSSHTGLKILVGLCVLAALLYYLWNAGYLDFVEQLGKGDNQQTSELQSADTYMAAKDAEKSRREALATTPPPRQENTSERVLPLPGNQPVPAPPAIEPASPEPVAPQPVIEANPVVRPDEVPAPAQQAVEAREETVPGQHKLIITAVEECWIHSNADKTDTRQFSLRKGDTFALTFADSLELKLGNAGGVRLRYDGSDLPPPGSSGQVRTLTFPPKTNS